MKNHEPSLIYILVASLILMALKHMAKEIGFV